MEEMYCFEDWYSGKVNLDTEPLYNVGNDKSPNVVSINSFSEQDQKRILDEKRIIFDEKVLYVFDGFKNEFLLRFDNSNYKLRLLDSHIKESFAILNNKIPNVEIIKTKYWEIFFAKEDLIKIQNYYKKYLLKGITNNFHFVHSVNSEYYNEDFVKNEVYSSAMNNFYIFLTKLKNRIKNKLKNTNSKSQKEGSKENPELEEEKDIINIDPKIFANKHSSEFFLEYVSKVKKIQASFGTFYTEFSPILGFKHKVGKIEYCDFINSYFKGVFILNDNDIKSKSRSLKNKSIFENIKKNYKEKNIQIPFVEE